jgi:DNA gyrase subunit A
LPGKFPNLLVNGSTGIAVGMACNLPPHNVSEICDAIVFVIDHPDCTLPDLLNIVPGPDFPTGGIICGRDGIIEGYTSGRGRITLRAKLEVEEQKNGRNSIIVTELPYGIIRKTIVEAAAEAVKKDQIKDISAINDESGRQHKVRIVIDLKRDGDPELVMRQLYQYTPCEITVSIINIALVNRQPRTMGLKELILHFIDHRKEVITRRTQFLLKKAQQRRHILQGLVYAVFDIDEVVRIIRASKTREEAMDRLMSHNFWVSAKHPEYELVKKHAADFKVLIDERVEDAASGAHRLTQVQAEAIGALRLIQLVGLEINKLIAEYDEVAEHISEYERILGDQAYLMDIIREDIFEMKEKFGSPRLTQIEGDVSEYNMESLIASEDVVVTKSHEGYMKRLPIDTYRSQGRGGRGVKGTEAREGDFVEQIFIGNTHDYLLFFTNSGRVYERRVYDIPEMSRTSQGRAIANLLELQPGEKVANVLTVKDFSREEHFLMFATAKGVVKKTALSAYANIRQNGIIAIGLEEGDSLIGVECTSGKDHVMLGTKSGLAIRFDEADVRAMGRPAGGVTGARFKREGDEVVSMLVIPEGKNEGLKVLTACVNGFGKRTPLEDYPVKGRGTRGVINIDANERNGEVVGMTLVEDNSEVMLITEKGILIRTRISEIRETGRNAAGVRLIKVDEGDKLVAMAKVDAEEEAEKASGESATPPTPPAPKTDGDGESA